MAKLHLAAGVILALIVSACATPDPSHRSQRGAKAQPTNVAARPNWREDEGLRPMTYRIENARPVGLVQAFVRDGRTFIQSYGDRPLQVRATPGGQLVDFERRGDYLIVPGLQQRLYVSDGAQTAVVKKLARVALMIQDFKTGGVIQAFTDGETTFLQTFPDASPLVRTAPTSGPLVYVRDGEYLVVSGVHSPLYVSEGQRRAQAEVPTPRAQAEPEIQPAAFNADVDDQGLRADIAAVQEQLRAARLELEHTRAKTEQINQSRGELELARLKVEPSPATAPVVVTPLETPKLQSAVRELPLVIPGEATKPRVLAVNRGKHLLHFKSNSTQFATDPESLEATLPLFVAGTERIVLRGRTALGEPANLARERALAARKVLIDRGVDPSRITVLSQANAFYISDNNSEAGRAQNRRVEIEIAPPSARRSAPPAGAMRPKPGTES